MLNQNQIQWLVENNKGFAALYDISQKTLKTTAQYRKRHRVRRRKIAGALEFKPRGAVKYASGMNGRSLEEVVDDNVRRKVQAMVGINMVNAQAEALKTTATRWNGSLNLPSWVVLPQGMLDTINGWLINPPRSNLELGKLSGFPYLGRKE